MAPDGRPQGIFISYRRDDARGASGRLYDWLRIAFGREHVFRDVASIGAGKWRVRIDDALAASAVFLAVIGPRWCDDANGPRLNEDGDMVRHEILTALTRADHLTLIPTLIEGTPPPPCERLPAELLGLLKWNAFPLSETGWEDDMRRLIVAVAQASGRPAAGDIDSLLALAHEAETRMRSLEQELDLRDEQIRALIDSVHALTRQFVEAPPSQRAELSKALAALARGERGAAEAEFERVLEAKSAEARAATEQAAQATHEAAEAARHIAGLALLDNVEKALRYFQHAAELEPKDTWTHFFIGDLCVTTGNLDAAMKSYQDAAATIEERLTANAEDETALADLSANHERIGIVLLTRGDAPEAWDAQVKALDIREALAGRDSGNTARQRNLLATYTNLGDVLAYQGDRPGVLEAYRKALSIAEALAKCDSASAQSLCDVGICYGRVGDVLRRQGVIDKAVDAYIMKNEIFETLVAREPENTWWQFELAIAYSTFGDVQMVQTNHPAALGAYRKSLAIAEGLAERDPENSRWQVGLTVVCAKLGSHSGVPRDEQRALLQRGRTILHTLKSAGRLPPSQDTLGWFDEAIASCTHLD